MSEQAPALWIGHVVLESDRLDQSAAFMRAIGLREIHPGPGVAVFELRGGTHLIILAKDAVAGGEAKFDLMVEDLHATHARFAALGLAPTAIEAVPAISHEKFTVREPAGHVITVFSDHRSGRPV